MARPCKSVKTLTDYSQTKAELNEREKEEETLRGSSDSIIPPEYLSDSQIEIFQHIVEQLKASGILGNLDIYILTQCCIAIDRLQQIEKRINHEPDMLLDKDLLSAKDKYTKDFFRCCNELSLSPQSRAKLANINLQKKEKPKLLQALNDDD